ncbi:MAG: hypothetical protein ACFCD0_17370 [Gemmataceae bacterium]
MNDAWDQEPFDDWDVVEERPGRGNPIPRWLTVWRNVASGIVCLVAVSLLVVSFVGTLIASYDIWTNQSQGAETGLLGAFFFVLLGVFLLFLEWRFVICGHYKAGHGLGNAFLLLGGTMLFPVVSILVVFGLAKFDEVDWLGLGYLSGVGFVFLFLGLGHVLWAWKKRKQSQ